MVGIENHSRAFDKSFVHTSTLFPCHALIAMTEIALSSYTPPQDPPATLGKLIEALRILLLPDPLLSFLPTSLEYLSTFQRFAEVIYHQARAVRDADDRLCVKLENNGVPGAEWVEQGALSEGDRRKLDDMGEEFGGLHRHYSNEMLELSIQLRLYVSPNSCYGSLDSLLTSLAAHCSASSESRGRIPSPWDNLSILPSRRLAVGGGNDLTSIYEVGAI